MTTPDMDEALDWLGRPVDCKTCRYADRLAEGKCQPLKACVHDRYAKRIQRFFQWNEDLAVENLDHPYFEVRAIAVRHAPAVPPAAPDGRHRRDGPQQRRPPSAPPAPAQDAERPRPGSPDLGRLPSGGRRSRPDDARRRLFGPAAGRPPGAGRHAARHDARRGPGGPAGSGAPDRARLACQHGLGRQPAGAAACRPAAVSRKS